jgi:hypothetical protein
MSHHEVEVSALRAFSVVGIGVRVIDVFCRAFVESFDVQMCAFDRSWMNSADSRAPLAAFA